MKKIITFLAFITLLLTACSKDQAQKFDYDLSILYGTWRITEILQENGSFLDVTSSVAEKVFAPTYATFNADGTYSGRGFFGNGTGTYKAEGKTIYTYIDGEEYLRYIVKSLNGNTCHLVMTDENHSAEIEFKCKKQ